MGDKLHITFVDCCTRDFFLPIQLIYSRKTKGSLLNFFSSLFLNNFHGKSLVTVLQRNLWNFSKREINSLTWKISNMIKVTCQNSLTIMDTFKVKDKITTLVRVKTTAMSCTSQPYQQVSIFGFIGKQGGKTIHSKQV